MSKDIFNESEDTALNQVMVTRPNTGLAQKIAKRLEEDKQRMRSLFASKELNENTAQPPPSDTEFKKPEESEEARASQEDMEAGKDSEVAESKDEAEPQGLDWKLVSYSELQRLFSEFSPPVSDIKMTVSGAVQQPHMAFPLVTTKDGKKFLVKADEVGQLYVTLPTKDSKVFFNLGMNTDYDADKDDVHASTQIAPAFTKAPEQKEFGLKIKGQKDEYSPMPYYKNKALTAMLVDEALNSPKKKITIPESTQKTIQLTELNKLLYRVQKALNETNDDTLEKFATKLSDIIAEALLTGRKAISYSLFESCEKEYNSLIEG